MANSTVRGARQVHGTNPQFLIEKVIRARIYDNLYWKEECFGLNATSLIDKAVALQYIGGTFGPQKPSPFLCLVLKLLQLQPPKEIILEYLKAEELKYLRAVAALYARLTFPAIEVYETLEPMLNDYRKLRYRHQSGSYTLTHMDEFVDELLTQERVCELILPRIAKRELLEETEGLAPRMSKLEEVLLNGSQSAAGQDCSDSEREASDDSMRQERQRRFRRVEKARAVRQKREEDAKRFSRQPQIVKAAGTGQKEDPDETYDSQQSTEEEAEEEPADEGGRYVSRSPSRSVSPDRVRPQGEPDSDADMRSTGHRSRSGSRSPDR